MRRAQTDTALWGIAGKTGYPVSCIAAALVLVVSGFSYFVVRDVGSIGSSHAIASGPSIGAQNILLMGLESRRDWNGNILPDEHPRQRCTRAAGRASRTASAEMTRTR